MSINARTLKRAINTSKNKRCQVKETALELFPSELLLKIFSYLDPESLMLSSCTCKRWKLLSENNLLWEHIYRNIFGARKYLTTKKDANCQWMELFVRHSRRMRNKRLLSQLKTNPYLGIENKVCDILKTLGVSFQLCLLDEKGNEYNYMQSKFSPFNVSISLTWNSLVDFLQWDKVRKIRLYALVPLVYLKEKNLLNFGPKQRSLISEVEMKKDQVISLTSDDKVELKRVGHNMLVALWKDSKKIAFISGFIHHHKLIHKCMHSKIDQIFSPKHQVIQDDIDSEYGLHNYKCYLQLHTMSKSIWDNQLSYLKSERNKAGILINNNGIGQSFDNFTSFLWKTELFKGRISNLLILDVVLIDSNDQPINCDSIPIIGTMPNKSNSTIDFENGGEKIIFSYQKTDGYSFCLSMKKDGKCGKIENVEFQFSTEFINSWFGTYYS